MSTPYSLMNFDNNRQRAELIVRFDTISYAHLHKDVAADMAINNAVTEINNFNFLAGSKTLEKCILASNGTELKQQNIGKLELLVMPHNNGTMLNITTPNGDTIYFSDLPNERISDFMLVGWFFSRESSLLFTIVLIGENQRHPQIGVFECDDVEDTYLVDFIEDIMASCQN